VFPAAARRSKAQQQQRMQLSPLLEASVVMALPETAKAQQESRGRDPWSGP